LSEDENLFLHNLRSNLSVADMVKTLQFYKDRKLLDDKNIFLDRLVKANPLIFKEAINMFSEETSMKIIIDAMEEGGWLVKRDNEKAKKIARKMLSRGDSPNDVAEVTDLPLDVLMNLLNEHPPIPAGA